MGWTYFWRALGIVALIFMTVTTVLFWTAWRSSAFTPTADGSEIKTGIDVIAIQLDILSLVVAMVSFGLAFAGFVGYQAIKDAAIRKADEVATAAFALHMSKKDKEGTDGVTQAPVEPLAVTELTEEEKGE